MASDTTKQTISQSLNDLKAEVAERTKSIITGVKIPELESTLLISPTDKLIIETDSGTKKATMRTFGDYIGQGGASPKEVVDARNDGNTIYPQLKDRLDAMDGERKNNTQEIQAIRRDVTNITNKHEILNQEVIDARVSTVNRATTHSSLKNRIDSDYKELNNKIEFNKHFVNVKTYGAKGDGITDDTDAILLAFADKSSTCIYFPEGEYLITRPINITNKTKICGDTTIGGRKTIIKDISGLNQYIFVSDANENSAHYICNIGLQGFGCIDCRSNHANIIKNLRVINCVFKGLTQGGVAIHVTNTDFTVIEKNYFEGLFYCNIRISGYLDSNVNNNKKSTATQILQNTFIDWENRAGRGSCISLEEVDSITISENDFCYNGVVIDVGGYYYLKNIVINNDYYFTNQPNRNKSVGCCTNVIIENNHFESYTYGVYSHGGDIENHHNIKVVHNNFQTPQANSVAIEFAGNTFNSTTSRNEIDLKDEGTASGIIFTWCHNCLSDLDSIYGISQNFVVNKGGHGNVIFKKTTPGKKRNEVMYGCPEFDIPTLKTSNITKSFDLPIPDGKPKSFEISSTRNFSLQAHEVGNIVDLPQHKNFIGSFEMVSYDSYGNERIMCLINGSDLVEQVGMHHGFTLKIENGTIKLTNGSTASDFFIVYRISGVCY